MTEQQYIDVSDLARIRSVYEILRNVLPETSSVITKEEHIVVMKQISEWQTKLFKKVKIT